VDAGDYVVWRNSIGQTGSDTAEHPADGNHDYVVGNPDYSVWRSYFDQPSSFGAGSGSGSDLTGVPEPTGCLFGWLASLGIASLRKRRRALTPIL
jgi:hypothetical protein